MDLWRRLLRSLGLQPIAEKRRFKLDAALVDYVQTLAEQERRPPEDLAADLLASGLERRDQMYLAAHCWGRLTPREQQVAALACLGYSNRQIAGRMVITIETVKSHMTSVLRKFELVNRSELRQALDGWDFSEWDRQT
jgi:DNA-binding NarL/FixJ family response regulator